MGNLDSPTSEHRGASMCYLTTLMSGKRRRYDSREDTQLARVGLSLRTLESQQPNKQSNMLESTLDSSTLQ